MLFYMPVKVFLEKDAVRKNAGVLASAGSKALIVTGKRSAKLTGALDDVIYALESEGKAYAVFDGIEENPSVETLFKAKDFALEEGADFVIGVGGGSPMDASKAIAVLAANPDKDSDFLWLKHDKLPAALPVIAVPTTCGTGSEVTGVAVITRNDIRTKMSMSYRIFPQYAFVDGKYLAKAPRSVINNTATDAFAHLVESKIHSKYNDMVETVNSTGLMVFSRTKDKLYNNVTLDEDDYMNLMEASLLAGMSIAQSGTSIPHGLSYTLTYERGVPHGKAVGRFLGGYMKHAGKDVRDDILSKAGFGSVDEYEDFYAKLCLTENDPIVTDKALLDLCFTNILANPAKLASCPYDVDEEILRDIIY